MILRAPVSGPRAARAAIRARCQSSATQPSTQDPFQQAVKEKRFHCTQASADSQLCRCCSLTRADWGVHTVWQVLHRPRWELIARFAHTALRNALTGAWACAGEVWVTYDECAKVGPASACSVHCTSHDLTVLCRAAGSPSQNTTAQVPSCLHEILQQQAGLAHAAQHRR